MIPFCCDKRRNVRSPIFFLKKLKLFAAPHTIIMSTTRRSARSRSRRPQRSISVPNLASTSSVSTTSKKRKKPTTKAASTRKKPAFEPDPNTTKCAICLDKVTTQGVLDKCKHLFCFDCIIAWAEKENTCPLCKKRFHGVSKLDVILLLFAN